MMRFLSICVTCCLLQHIPLHAQTPDDPFFKKIASIQASDVKGLHRALSKAAPAETDYVKACYIWLATHIDYDVVEWKRNSPESVNQQPDVVMRRRKAVCEGYAGLMKTLCKMASIPCFEVPGYGKVGGVVNKAGHMWCSVYTGGSWYLIDPTWGTGHVDEANRYKRHFNKDYFMTSPETFAADHYPLDPVWQLTESPRSLNAFVQDKWYGPDPEPFHFRDTIALWLQADSLEREIAAGMRMIRYAPQDSLADFMYNLALLRAGDAAFDKMARVLADINAQKPKNGAEARKRLPDLETAEQYGHQANDYYERVGSGSRELKQTMKHNREALLYNMQVVAKLRTLFGEMQ